MMRWVTISSCWELQSKPLLAALTAKFPQFSFRLGGRGRGEFAEVVNIHGRLPYPHPNDFAREVSTFAEEWCSKNPVSSLLGPKE